MKRLLPILIAFLFLPFFTFAQIDQSERIINFRSDVRIEGDSSIIVKETIAVYANGDKIRRGIYRDFPTTYEDDKGNNFRVGFEVLDVKKDGVAEDYHDESLSNGMRIYIGNESVYLSPGTYVYELTYRTDRQIGFFDDHDELYWNVTGNGWEFAIESAEAHIEVPEGVSDEAISVFGYTGPFGAQGTHYRAEVADGVAHFYTTAPLGSAEGLTVVAGWPKGFLIEPTDAEKFQYFLRDNLFLLLGILIAFITLVYYAVVWKKHGDDPEARSIIAQYEPPRGLSPASMGFISNMGYSDKVMASALINMAVKGHIKIQELKVNYRVTLIGINEELLSEEEKKLSKNFFEKGDVFEISQTHYGAVMEAVSDMKTCLKNAYEGIYFVRNGKYLAIGILFSILAVALSLLNIQGDDKIVASFMILWLSLWSLGVIAIAQSFFKSRKNSKGRFSLVFSFLIFASIEIGVLYFLSTLLTSAVMGTVLVIIAINIVFGILLPRRTVEGRLVQDEIEGFKLFLSVTEKDRMNFHNPPERTPELFEKFLPYALALGVENKWAEQFEEVFKNLYPDGYHPAWYNGSSLSNGSLAGFASGMSSSLGGSISSSSQAPGSSSGGGGGGSSGGGGGGGGGGGW